RRLDHADIYLFIAATYTPVVVTGLHDAVGYWLLAATWAGAVLGATAKLVRLEGSRVIGGTMYIVVGWLAILGVHDFVTSLGVVDTVLMYGGGVVYTAGAVVLASRRPDPFPEVFGYHEVWHALVVVGSVCHFALFWRLVAR
ncbi:MAG: hemolysin III family protein, partial [Actinobacteria bacterium]|nr:hemolysin III family protein [Actinomycetota bacterium]